MRKYWVALQVREEPPWQQLATATHAAQQLPEDPATAKPHIKAWNQALHKNELQLLQLHVAATLQKPCWFHTSVLDAELVVTWCAALSHGESATVLEPVNSMVATTHRLCLC